MNWNKKTLKAAGLALLLAMLLRLIGTGVFGSTLGIFAQPQLASFLIYTESGRAPQQTPPVTTTQPPQTTAREELVDPSTEPTEPVPETTKPAAVPREPAVFTPEDKDLVELENNSKRKPDVEALLTKPLNWDLTGQEPKILIMHTHGTEAFTPTADTTYQEDGGEYRTLDETLNVVSLGAELTRLLEAAGFSVIHDQTYYDYPDYIPSYDNAREGMEKLLDQYPSIELVIDLHRDAAEYQDGTQWATSATVNGEQSAQVMLVVGTNSYYAHPNWEQNFSVASKLQVLMEKAHPGAARPMDLRKQRFNQDLSTGAIIAEIGAAGNTHAEAMNAVTVLAEAIIQLSKGAN